MGEVVRVLVCGGRDFHDRNLVFHVLNSLCGKITNETPLGTIPLHIIHGACGRGADLWADEYAVVCLTGLSEYPADWKRYGPAAGPIRNQRMIDEGKPDLVIAFPGGRGTADMIRRARAAGIEVREIEAAQ